MRRNDSRRPVISTKNINTGLSIVAANTTEVFVIANAVDSAALATTNTVERGSKINTVFVEQWIYGNATAGVNSRISWGFFKNPGANLTAPSPSVAGISDNKKFYYAMGTGLVGNSANGQPGYLVKGWFSIPKGYRTFGANDQLQMIIRNDTANDINVCRMFIYKWYK